MTSTRWAIWLGTFGAGACIALGAGHGVAAADDGAAGSADRPSAAARSAADASPAETTEDDQGTTEDDEAATDADAGPTTPDGADEALDGAVDDDVVDDGAVTDDADTGAATPDDADDADATPDDDEIRTDDTAADVTPLVREGNSTSRTEYVDATGAVPLSVTGVQTGHAKLTIPVESKDYTTRADWYLPTQADGSVSATGVIWLQHGFLGSKATVSNLARTLAQQTNSIVVAPNVSSFPIACSGCWINGVPMQEAVASMFLGDRTLLSTSATMAGFVGVLPEHFVMSGHSAGGGFAAAVGGYYADDTDQNDPDQNDLRGVVMFDGFSFGGVLTKALDKLDDPFIPVYQVGAPPQPWNSAGASTTELIDARPGQFVGVTLAGGSHVDSLIGGSPFFDVLAQLATGFSPAGNTLAAYTLATGWINDMYNGLGPVAGQGIYGAPDQYIVLGDAAVIVLAPPPPVDLARYLGTWFEVGSVKQFFSIGLVNTTAVYSANPDKSIKVENSGNYFVNDGPRSTIVGSALPVDPSGNKLNVKFFGAPAATPPGNYWIVDLDPDYQWAVVTDPTGRTGFLLTRDRVVTADFYRELLNRASVKGVKGRITPTRQPAADQTAL